MASSPSSSTEVTAAAFAFDRCRQQFLEFVRDCCELEVTDDEASREADERRAREFCEAFDAQAILANGLDVTSPPERPLGLPTDLLEATPVAKDVTLRHILTSGAEPLTAMSHIFVLAALGHAMRIGSEDAQVEALLRRIRTATENGTHDEAEPELGDATLNALVARVADCYAMMGEGKDDDSASASGDGGGGMPRALEDLMDMMKDSKIADIAQDLGSELSPELMQQISEDPGSLLKPEHMFDGETPIGKIIKKLVAKMEEKQMSAPDVAAEAMNLLSKISQKAGGSSSGEGASGATNPVAGLMNLLGGGGNGDSPDFAGIMNTLTQSLRRQEGEGSSDGDAGGGEEGGGGGSADNPMADMLNAFMKSGDGEEAEQGGGEADTLANMMGSLDLNKMMGSMDLNKMMASMTGGGGASLAGLQNMARNQQKATPSSATHRRLQRKLQEQQKEKKQ